MTDEYDPIMEKKYREDAEANPVTPSSSREPITEAEPEDEGRIMDEIAKAMGVPTKQAAKIMLELLKERGASVVERRVQSLHLEASMTDRREGEPEAMDNDDRDEMIADEREGDRINEIIATLRSENAALRGIVGGLLEAVASSPSPMGGPRVMFSEDYMVLPRVFETFGITDRMRVEQMRARVTTEPLRADGRGGQPEGETP